MGSNTNPTTDGWPRDPDNAHKPVRMHPIGGGMTDTPYCWLCPICHREYVYSAGFVETNRHQTSVPAPVKRRRR